MPLGTKANPEEGKKKPAYLKRLEEMKHVSDGLNFKKGLYMGEAGVGKTTLSATFPNWLFMDFDKNMRVIPDTDRRETHRFPFQRGDDIETLVKDILLSAKEGTGMFAEGELWSDVQTIVFDSIHKMSDWLLFYIVKNVLKKDPKKDKPGFDGYGLLKNSWQEIVELMKDVPFHVVCLSGVRTFTKEDEGTIEVQPMIEGSFRDMIAHEFGEVYYLTRETTGVGKDKKIQYVGYSNVYKNIRMLKSTHVFPDGSHIPSRFINPTYERLYVKGEFD